MKNVPGFKGHPIFLIALLLACTIFFASCGDDNSSNGSPTSVSNPTQASAITPIGAQATCLTINSPSLVKLADGNYKLVGEVNNCSGKDAGPLKVTTQIDTDTTKQSTDLMGPATISANGKATYQTLTGQTSGTNQEIHFPSPLPPFAVVTISATVNGTVQGEWDGQVKIPS